MNGIRYLHTLWFELLKKTKPSIPHGGPGVHNRCYMYQSTPWLGFSLKKRERACAKKPPADILYYAYTEDVKEIDYLINSWVVDEMEAHRELSVMHRQKHCASRRPLICYDKVEEIYGVEKKRLF